MTDTANQPVCIGPPHVTEAGNFNHNFSKWLQSSRERTDKKRCSFATLQHAPAPIFKKDN